MSANNSSYSDVTYSFANNADNFKKAFCVAPPDEGCPPWGPCPNTDVTGLGNEISIYITTVIYGVILCYVPWLKRPMLYAHLSILYSLVIAGTVSIAKHELTKADGIFVLICASSPASIYLWYLSFRSFWNANIFPIVHSNKNKTASESYEVKITRIITLGTFAWVLALLIITFVPSKVIKFSQPGCNTAYGTALWFNLAWELPVALQSVVIVVLYYVSWGIFKLWTGRRSYQAPHSSLVPVLGYETAENSYEAVNKPSSKTTQPDIITWTETILNEQFPDFMDDTLRICIVTLLQITSLPTLQLWPLPIDSKDLLAWFMLTYGMFRHRPKHYTNWVKQYAIRVAISSVLAGYYVVRWWYLLSILPTAPDWVFFFVACTAAAWCRQHYSSSSMRIFLPFFLVIFGLCAVAADAFVVMVGDAKLFADPDVVDRGQPDGNDYSYLILNIPILCLWIVSWLATTVWPFKRGLTWDKLNKGLFKRAHLFKAFWIVLGPHILWIQAANNASPSRSSEMPFGQIFALIVAVVTLFTLLDEAKDVDKAVWKAFFFSDPMPYDDEERPKHYAVRPGLAMS